MDPVVILADTRLQVEPGEQVQTTATVRNAGEIVEEYRLELLGEAAAWAEIIPRELSVLPYGEQQVQILFRPPRDGSTPAGNVPFGIRCVSMEDRDSIAVVEGDLTVGAVLDLDAQLVPTVRRGRWSSGYRVQLENRGSVPMQLQLAASDPRQALSFALAPNLLEVPAGGRAQATLKVRTRSPVMRGQLQQHGFQVGYQRLAAAPGAGAGQLDGMFEQLPIISKGLLALAALAVAAVVAAFLLLRPEPGSGGGGGLPPATPTVQEVTAIGSDRVRLVWDLDPNASGYEVRKLVAGGDAVEKPEPVPEAQNAFTWEGLAPGQEHCFQVAAKNDAGFSDPTDARCAQTLEVADFDPPSGVQATPDGDGVRVQWTTSDETATHVVLIDGAEAGEAPAGISTIRVPADPGKRCARVYAVKGEAASKQSDEACATVGGGSTGGPTTGPTGGGTTAPPTDGITPGDAQGSFAFLDNFSRDLQADAIQKLQELTSKGFAVKLLDSRNVQRPGLPFGNQEYLLLVVDGFASKSEAQAFCDAHPQDLPDCVAVA